MVCVFENRQAAQNFPGGQHLAADAADYLLEPQLVSVGVIALSTSKLPETDGHHFEQAAFDFSRKIGVPLDAPNQHHSVAFEGISIHESLDSFVRAPHRYNIERTNHRTAHGGLDDAVVRQNVGLPFRGGGAVAAHAGKD